MNRLASETSPYLRQHAGNPVDWYAWGDEAFDAARRLDRPVMLSVGYSSCHWCHVMAHESFEDEATAADLNDHFVAVKVDREERPDVDAVYMEAVQAVSGRGGWPMTVFLTPDARPFFAGTYFPATGQGGVPSFRQVLEAIDDAWRNRRVEIETQADALSKAVASRSRISDAAVEPSRNMDGSGVAERAPVLLHDAAGELRSRFDTRWGGFTPAPKFPNPGLVELCLLHHRFTSDEYSLEMARRTLKAMASGGIFDQLGGGFHRYSTDGTWTVPHFEKMLYDQAGLLRVYLHAWQSTSEAQWLDVVEQTASYVLRDLALSDGGICSAEDADSEGEEGSFYLWTPGQMSEVLGQARGDLAIEWFGVTEAGNFEGRSILRRPLDGTLERPGGVEEASAALFAARARRERPARDDKVLTEWNAMFGSALSEAAGATGREDWVRAATRIGEFLLSEMRRPDGRWLRSWQSGRAQHLAYAADHAWLVDFFTRLAELTGRRRWLEHARETARVMLELFSSPGLPLDTAGSDAQPLVVQPMELADGATPSATSVAGAALLRLAALVGDDELRVRGESLLSALLSVAEGQPLAVASALAAGVLAGGEVTEVVVGGDRPDLVAVARARYEPTQVLAWGQPTSSPLWEGRDRPVAYVCRHYSCRTPSETTEELRRQLDAEREADRARFAGAGPR